MKVIDLGHKYLVDSYDGGYPYYVIFMKREGEKFPGNVGKYSGTNCQEIIRVLIDRVQYLDEQDRCVENKQIIENLRLALEAFEVRAARRHGRTLIYNETPIEKDPYCSTCGHIQCKGH